MSAPEERMRTAIEAFAASVEDAERRWSAPRGGQHVPDHSDWAAAPPSVRARLRWWAREMLHACRPGGAA